MFRDIYEFKSDDEIAMRSAMLGKDGPFEIRPADRATKAMIAQRVMHTNLEA